MISLIPVGRPTSLVARGLEREWEESLSALEAAKAELARRESARPCVLSKDERNRLLALGADLTTVWHAETTTPRDRKQLLRALIEEVIVKVERDKAAARLTLRWKGGALDEIDLALPRSRPATIRTDEDTIALVRRLAEFYPDTDRRHSQSPGAHHCIWSPLRSQPRRQPAPPLEHSLL